MSTAAKPGTQVVLGELHRVRRGHRKGFSSEPPPEAERRPARVAVALALAHMIQRAIDKGEIRDQAEAARKLGVTRARITQILDLTLLAPDLQEKILLLEAVDGREPACSRGLKGHLRVFWAEQRVDRRFLHALQDETTSRMWP